MTGLNRLLRPEEGKKKHFLGIKLDDVTLEFLFVLINHPVTPLRFLFTPLGVPNRSLRTTTDM